MRICAVPGCRNRYSCKDSKVHTMPKDECLKAEWMKAVPDLGSSKSKLPTVCSLHFKCSDYSGKLKKYLKSTAVPSLNLDLGDEDQRRLPRLLMKTKKLLEYHQSIVPNGSAKRLSRRSRVWAVPTSNGVPIIPPLCHFAPLSFRPVSFRPVSFRPVSLRPPIVYR
jgi:hypothetical protein